MKYHLLFLLMLCMKITDAQVNIEIINRGNGSYCRTILDSLQNTLYFNNSIKLPDNKLPEAISIYSSEIGGCLFAVYSNSEVIYSEGNVYFLYENSGGYRIKSYDSEFVLDIISVLNSSYAMDQTILIKNTKYNEYNTGASCESIKIKVLYDGGVEYKNEIKYCESNSFCKYLPQLLNFIHSGYETSKNMHDLSFNELCKLFNNQKSKITNDFIYGIIDTMTIQEQKHLIKDPECRQSMQLAYLIPNLSEQMEYRIQSDFMRKGFPSDYFKPINTLPTLIDILIESSEKRFLSID